MYDKGVRKVIDTPRISLPQFKGKLARTSALIVKFRGGLSKTIHRFNKTHGVVKRVMHDSKAYIYVLHFPKKNMHALSRLAKAYHDSGLAEFAEPYVIHSVMHAAITFNDPKFPSQWIFEKGDQRRSASAPNVGISSALQLIESSNIKPQNICIAVLDEGVDTEHPDFINSDGSTLWESNFNVFDNSADPKPKQLDNHGTSIAGIIAARSNNGEGIVGLNPFCKIMAGRLYFTFDGPFANPLLMEKGIRHAVDHGARVINLSWSIEHSAVVADAIDYGFKRNVVFCVSAGNFQKRDRAVLFPGSLDNVITVGACDQQSQWVDFATCPADPKFGSRVGRALDLVAPGVFITTTTNQAGYTDKFGGTSAATAIVSAAAGLVLSINPTLTNIEVRDILLSTCDPVIDANGNTDPQKTGHGKININSAVKAAIASLSA